MNGGCEDWTECDDGSRCCGEDCCGGKVAIKNTGLKPDSPDYIYLRRKWHKSATLHFPGVDDGCTDKSSEKCAEVTVYRAIAYFEKNRKAKAEVQIYLVPEGGDAPVDDE